MAAGWRAGGARNFVGNDNNFTQLDFPRPPFSHFTYLPDLIFPVEKLIGFLRIPDEVQTHSAFAVIFSTRSENFLLLQSRACSP